MRARCRSAQCAHGDCWRKQRGKRNRERNDGAGPELRGLPHQPEDWRVPLPSCALCRCRQQGAAVCRRTCRESCCVSSGGRRCSHQADSWRTHLLRRAPRGYLHDHEDRQEELQRVLSARAHSGPLEEPLASPITMFEIARRTVLSEAAGYQHHLNVMLPRCSDPLLGTARNEHD